jgi:hypothetical protein
MKTLRDAFAFVWNSAVIGAFVAGGVVGRISEAVTRRTSQIASVRGRELCRQQDRGGVPRSSI